MHVGDRQLAIYKRSIPFTIRPTYWCVIQQLSNDMCYFKSELFIWNLSKLPRVEAVPKNKSPVWLKPKVIMNQNCVIANSNQNW